MEPNQLENESDELKLVWFIWSVVFLELATYFILATNQSQSMI